MKDFNQKMDEDQPITHQKDIKAESNELSAQETVTISHEKSPISAFTRKHSSKAVSKTPTAGNRRKTSAAKTPDDNNFLAELSNDTTIGDSKNKSFHEPDSIGELIVDTDIQVKKAARKKSKPQEAKSVLIPNPETDIIVQAEEKPKDKKKVKSFKKKVKKAEKKLVKLKKEVKKAKKKDVKKSKLKDLKNKFLKAFEKLRMSKKKLKKASK